MQVHGEATAASVWEAWRALSPGWSLVALVLVLLSALWLERRTRHAWQRWRAQRRGRRAYQAEVDAEAFLRKRGYRVLEVQPRLAFRLRVDGAEERIELRADMLVERDGECFVAEVKSGPRVASIQSAATRRQLLEYLVAYPVDGVLLVDMHRRAILRVDFGAAADTLRRAA